jgi:hypothetical protein
MTSGQYNEGVCHVLYTEPVDSGTDCISHTHTSDALKRGLKRRLTCEYRYDERLKTKNEESTRLSDTALHATAATVVFYLKRCLKVLEIR